MLPVKANIDIGLACGRAGCSRPRNTSRSLLRAGNSKAAVSDRADTNDLGVGSAGGQEGKIDIVKEARLDRPPGSLRVREVRAFRNSVCR
jgi:hypothetical protein